MIAARKLEPAPPIDCAADLPAKFVEIGLELQDPDGATLAIFKSERARMRTAQFWRRGETCVAGIVAVDRARGMTS